MWGIGGGSEGSEIEGLGWGGWEVYSSDILFQVH